VIDSIKNGVMVCLCVALAGCGVARSDTNSSLDPGRVDQEDPIGDVPTALYTDRDQVGSLSAAQRQALCDEVVATLDAAKCQSGEPPGKLNVDHAGCLALLGEIGSCSVDDLRACGAEMRADPCVEDPSGFDACVDVESGCPGGSSNSMMSGGNSSASDGSAGSPCSCGPFDFLCSGSATQCDAGLICLWAEGSEGYCTKELGGGADRCPAGFERSTYNGVELCMIDQSVGLCQACQYSYECESVSQGGGISFTAACFQGRCITACDPGSDESCGCVAATPTTGDARGYCSDDCG